MVSICPPISSSISPLFKPLETAPSAPITFSITFTLLFHSFFSSLVRSKCSSLHFPYYYYYSFVCLFVIPPWASILFTIFSQQSLKMSICCINGCKYGTGKHWDRRRITSVRKWRGYNHIIFCPRFPFSTLKATTPQVGELILSKVKGYCSSGDDYVHTSQKNTRWNIKLLAVYKIIDPLGIFSLYMYI